jgi:hypothetical protein
MKSDWKTGLVSNTIIEKAKSLPLGIRNLKIIRILKKALRKVRA